METPEEILSQQKYSNLSLSKLINTIHYDSVEFDEKALRYEYKRREVNQVTKQPKRHIRFKITAPPGTYQVDIVFVPISTAALSKQKAFLLFVEVGSRKAFAYLMKGKTLKSIIAAYEQFVMEEGGILISLEGGNDFNRPQFRKLLDDQAVNLITFVAKDIHINQAGDALGIIDRAVRTLKRLTRKLGLLKGTGLLARYFLQAVDNYNASVHSAFNNQKTPNEMHESFDESNDLHKATSEANGLLDDDLQKLKPGDRVRILLETKQFGKEKQPFSQQLYEITKKDGLKYRVRSCETHKLLRRRFNARELQLVDTDALIRLPSTVKPSTPEQDLHTTGARRRRMAREGIYNNFELEKLSEAPIPKLRVDTTKFKANRPVTERRVGGKLIRIRGPAAVKKMHTTLQKVQEMD